MVWENRIKKSESFKKIENFLNNYPGTKISYEKLLKDGPVNSHRSLSLMLTAMEKLNNINRFFENRREYIMIKNQKNRSVDFDGVFYNKLKKSFDFKKVLNFMNDFESEKIPLNVIFKNKLTASDKRLRLILTAMNKMGVINKVTDGNKEFVILNGGKKPRNCDKSTVQNSLRPEDIKRMENLRVKVQDNLSKKLSNSGVSADKSGTVVENNHSAESFVDLVLKLTKEKRLTWESVSSDVGRQESRGAYSTKFGKFCCVIGYVGDSTSMMSLYTDGGKTMGTETGNPKIDEIISLLYNPWDEACRCLTDIS